MKFADVVELSVKRLEKDGVYLASDWEISRNNSEEHEKALWNCATHVRTGPGKSKLIPKDGVRLVFIGEEAEFWGIEQYKYFAFIAGSGSCLFVRVYKYRDFNGPSEGETVLISPEVPEYMLKKFATASDSVPVPA